MIRNFSEILGAVGFALAIAVCLFAMVGTSKAKDFSAEQRAPAPAMLSASVPVTCLPACARTVPV